MNQELKKRRILITGGCGFIGSNLVEYLIEHTDWHIAVLDDLSTGSLAKLKGISNFSEDRVSFFQGDIQNVEDVRKALQGCDLVVNLAAQTGVVPSIENPKEGALINVIGLLNLLEASRDNGIKRFVLASSSGAVLGDQQVPLNEDRVPRPLSPYGASKVAGEGYCSAFANSFNLPSVVLRFSNVYGPYSELKESIVAKFIKQILAREPVVLYGDGSQTRDFIHVQDASEALFLALTKELPEKFSLLHIGSGKATSIIELFSLLKKQFERMGIQVRGPVYEKERRGEMKQNYTDIQKAKEVLGFSPQISLEQGLPKTIEYLKDAS